MYKIFVSPAKLVVLFKDFFKEKFKKKQYPEVLFAFIIILSLYLFIQAVLGVEPRNLCLLDSCSTLELDRQPSVPRVLVQ